MAVKRVKHLAKSVLRGLALATVLAPVGAYRMAALLFGPARAFTSFSQAISLLPGLTGVYLRWACYRWVLNRCGTDAHIGFLTVISHSATEIGDRVYVGVGCMIGDARLQDDVLVGSHVSIINGGRQHGIDSLETPVGEQPGVYPVVTIGRDCWLGDRSLVMADVGEQAVVGAGSVVTQSVPARAIVVGSPARVIRMRGEP